MDGRYRAYAVCCRVVASTPHVPGKGDANRYGALRSGFEVRPGTRGAVCVQTYHDALRRYFGFFLSCWTDPRVDSQLKGLEPAAPEPLNGTRSLRQQ